MSQKPKLTSAEREAISDEVNRIAANAGADIWIHRRNLFCLYRDIESIIAARTAQETA